METKIYFIISLFFTIIICTIDNPHFYKGTHFFGEPRLAKNYLTTIDFWAGGGKTECGFNCCNYKTNILNIYGDDNLRNIGKNVPKNILEKFDNPYIANIWKKKNITEFGKIKFVGKFKARVYDIDIYQNFCNGFFAELFIPFSKLEISDISFDDQSTKFNAGPQVDFQKWRNFILNLDKELLKVGLRLNSKFHHTGIGDINLLFGWTYNNDDTTYLDYIDATFKMGILFPTGRQTNINHVFDLPQGYNGHWGLPLYFDSSIGLYDWLTLGIHAGSIFFANKIDTVRIKTDLKQNGFIKLTKACAEIHKGPLWNVGLFLKADHVTDGFSFILAYRYDQQQKTRLEPCDHKNFNFDIINSDSFLQGWQMHTVNLIAEYDFSTIECPNMPRINIFFDIPFRGKRIFRTKICGGGIGFDYAW